MAVTDKATFILNNEYKEQVDMLSDAQAGQLFRTILQYANEQKAEEPTDPLVGMVFSFIRQQMDKDYKKYEEVCQKRAEAGKKGGRPRKTIVNEEETPEDFMIDFLIDEIEKPNALFGKSEKAKKADSDCECESDCDNDCDYECDVDKNKTGRSSSRMMKNACAREEVVDNSVDNSMDNSVDNSVDTPVDLFGNKIIRPYGKETLAILEPEFEQYKAFINGLTRKYMNRSAKEFDYKKVIPYASKMHVEPNNVVYLTFDIERAELLEYVFERAAEQEHMNWKYIDGIMENYQIRDINTVREAVMNECIWHENRPRL